MRTCHARAWQKLEGAADSNIFLANVSLAVTACKQYMRHVCLCSEPQLHMFFCLPCAFCLHLQAAGLTTNGKTGQSHPKACDLPAGYFLRGPGIVAACPQGEYKTGSGGAAGCSKCPFGVTTRKEASASIAACTGGFQGRVYRYACMVQLQ